MSAEQAGRLAGRAGGAGGGGGGGAIIQSAPGGGKVRLTVDSERYCGYKEQLSSNSLPASSRCAWYHPPHNKRKLAGVMQVILLHCMW